MASPHKPERRSAYFKLNLRDEIAETKEEKGYRDWEVSTQHDPNHQASFKYIPNITHDKCPSLAHGRPGLMPCYLGHGHDHLDCGFYKEAIFSGK